MGKKMKSKSYPDIKTLLADTWPDAVAEIVQDAVEVDELAELQPTATMSDVFPLHLVVHMKPTRKGGHAIYGPGPDGDEIGSVGNDGEDMEALICAWLKAGNSVEFRVRDWPGKWAMRSFRVTEPMGW